MYTYDSHDQAVINARVAQFTDQTRRYLNGELPADDFRPLRLQNGLYIQKHAPMLRIAIPYGVLSSIQLHALADIAQTYDAGYGHFTTRQNLQLNGPELEAVPAILADLAKVQMHAVQTSGNVIRNVTVDHFAGIAPDEIGDPRPYAELIRQWSTDHPEFSFLPRKFKIAISGSPQDRAAIEIHDIGLRVVRDQQGREALDVYVGGGLGRTPIVAPRILEAVAPHDLLRALEAVLRVYNLHGRRDNQYKARIKILVRDLGVAQFKQQVLEQWAWVNTVRAGVPSAELERIRSQFVRSWPSESEVFALRDQLAFEQARRGSVRFAAWVKSNVHPHRAAGFCAVSISLKVKARAPGDATSTQMHVIADLAERYSDAELRVTHHQNLVLPHVKRAQLVELFEQLKLHGLAQANIGLATDIIACPGGDFCSLANARSLPLAEDIRGGIEAAGLTTAVGALQLNISGCINSCGHHHVADIGLLGVDKQDEEFYQITLGGFQGNGDRGCPYWQDHRQGIAAARGHAGY
jgi:sulfite reductase (NADPH) hemoprotein beta-component